MRAVICHEYGSPDALGIEERPKPAPKGNEVLIRVHATTVSSADWRIRSLNVPRGFRLLMRLAFGWRRPRQPVLGTELAGVVETVGQDVTKYRPGDAVFAFTGAKMGCHAEFRCLPEDGLLARKPANLSFEEAAALCFGGTTVLDFLRRAELQKGETLLVNGASGCVGTAAVQIARHLGATVTGICSNANAELVRSLGADRVIDYTKQNITSSHDTYDVIMDTVGNLSYSDCAHMLRDNGRLLLLVAGLPQLLGDSMRRKKGGRRVIAGPAAERAEDVQLLGELAEAGAYRPVVDRRYPFEEIVEAHRYVDSGRKRGNVVVTVS